MNKAILMGRLTKAPEMRTIQNGTSVTNFTVAVDRRFKNANGEREADFIPCVAWRQTAEFIARYFRKGQRIAVVGSIQTRNWDDQDGQRHYVTEVVVDEAYFAESKRSNEYTETFPTKTAPQKDDPETFGSNTVEADETGLPFDL